MTVVSIIDSALGAAENAAYCCGPNGVYASAGLSVIQAAIDIFFGGKDQDDEAHRPITKKELEDGIDTVVKAIHDAQLQSKLQGYTHDLASLQHGYATTLAAIKAGRGFDRSQDYLAELGNQSWDDFYKEKQPVIADDEGTLNQAVADLGAVKDPATAYATTELFAALVGMHMNYCHLLMLIDFNRAKLAYHEEHEDYLARKAAYDAAVAKAKQDAGTPVPPEPQAPTKPPPDFKKLVDGPWATALRDQLKEQAPVLEKRVSTLEAYHADLVSRTADRLKQVEVEAAPGGGYRYVDHQTGKPSGRYPSQAAAAMALQVYQGQLELEVEQAVRDDPGYAGLSADDQPVVSAEETRTLRRIVESWKTVHAYYEKANPSDPADG